MTKNAKQAIGVVVGGLAGLMIARTLMDAQDEIGLRFLIQFATEGVPDGGSFSNFSWWGALTSWLMIRLYLGLFIGIIVGLMVAPRIALAKPATS